MRVVIKRWLGGHILQPIDQLLGGFSWPDRMVNWLGKEAKLGEYYAIFRDERDARNFARAHGMTVVIAPQPIITIENPVDAVKKGY